MIIPEVTVEAFNEFKARGLTELPSISKLNTGNVRATFSKTIPKALRDNEEYNAYLIIKTPQGKFKYQGISVTEHHGRLNLTSQPDFPWEGYVNHGANWYHVGLKSLLRGRIKFSQKIIFPEIEHANN